MKDQDKLKLLVSKITEQVIGSMEKTDSGDSDLTSDTLVIFPAFVSSVPLFLSYLEATYPNATYVTFQEIDFSGNTFKTINVATKEECQKLMASLEYYKNIVLAASPISLLKRIANGEDVEFIEQVMTRAILCEKRVSALLDFKLPTLTQGTFFENLAGTLDDLKDMGVDIISLRQSDKVTVKALTLVTEAEVIQAHKKGKNIIKFAAGAIVTPLARDKAKELGISIDQ